jgi:hypothetical protein
MDNAILMGIYGYRYPYGDLWIPLSLWGFMDNAILMGIYGYRYPYGDLWMEIVIGLHP